MPIDTSIYQNIKRFESPSILDSIGKAQNLSGMAMQQKRMGQQIANEDKDAKHLQHLRATSVIGNALESLSGLPEEERARAFPQLQAKMMRDGIISADDADDPYDPGLYRQSLMQFRSSKEGMDKQLQQSQIAKNFAEAKHKGSTDPMAQYEQRLALKDRHKQAEDDREMRRYSNVQGWGISEGATPTKDDAKNFKSSVTASEGMGKSLSRLQELTDKYGTEMWPGAVKGEMSQLARDIQLQAKELYNLGVLNGPDMSLLETVMTNPTSMSEFFNPSGNERSSAGLQNFATMMKNRVDSQAGVLGFARKQQQVAAQPPKQNSSGSWDGLNEANASTPAVKHGTEDSGFIFMGGNPADSKSWKKAR